MTLASHLQILNSGTMRKATNCNQTKIF